MNVFVLCTGRCGSTTLANACQVFPMYTAGHETNHHKSHQRLLYPENHIEVDNRLSWMLGSLANAYPTAKYVHLKRDKEQVIKSFQGRVGISYAHSRYVLGVGHHSARHYVDTTLDNIEEFLGHHLHIDLNIEGPYDEFLEFIEVPPPHNEFFDKMKERHN